MAVIQNFELFEIIDSQFFSPRLNIHLQFRKSLSDKGKEGVRIKEEKKIKLMNLASPPFSPPESIPCSTAFTIPLSDPVSNKRKEKEIKGNESVCLEKQTHTDTQILFFKKFTDWIAFNAPRVHQFKEPFTIAEYLRIKNDFPIKTIETVLISIHNRADVLKKNISANLTFRNWEKREYKTESTNPEPLNNLNEQLKAISKTSPTATA